MVDEMEQSKFDLADTVKHLDEWIDYMVNHTITDEVVYIDELYDVVDYIVSEWVSDMGINGYAMEELERKLKEKGVKVVE